MADEDILHRGERHAGAGQLPADAHAAINHEWRVVHDDKIGGIGWADIDARSALGTEKHDFGAWLRWRLRECSWCGQRGGAAEGELQRIATVDHGVSPAFLVG